MASIDPGVDHPMLANDPATEWLGIELLALGDGHARIAMTLRPEMMNGFGITHGGMIFAFADSAFALACNSATADGSTVTVAAGVDVNFLAPTRAGQRITAVANRRQQNGRSGLYDVQVFSGDSLSDDAGSTVVAEFRGRSRTIPNRHTN
ncbi:hydroxyphenylacetyl-CoA thioesterase PaaI [Arthrobacter alpinus]|uniref:Phenylacetic acid degradation protein n=1 Tax=Arthrobacter alpinus TaxID=656366 RepID=A0A0S2LWK0_9MICC|nr:hydroxyphenylacetyl-CoA thioesterase PaaI [Arthrobacter alpinus]ALO65852.1 phenylacetic acid degradation protein [Arthrobacter alpinus]MDD0859337.1 hydroxyphenylacetyl-CoA thioesterase PaaI [Arthrobacter alpinus]